jgi:hypothetical protein
VAGGRSGDAVARDGGDDGEIGGSSGWTSGMGGDCGMLAVGSFNVVEGCGSDAVGQCPTPLASERSHQNLSAGPPRLCLTFHL